jgi:hypothetical protein
MKKIKDIYHWDLNVSLDTRDGDRITSAQVNTKSNIILDDISLWEKNDISLYTYQKIILEKKSWKNFDALEKKSTFSGIFSLKDIKIRNKKTNFTIFPYIITFQRYIKKWWLFWSTIMWCLLLLFILCLWFIDKIIIENRVNAGYERLLEVKQWKGGLEQIQKSVNNARFDLLLSDVLFSPFKMFPWDKISSVKHAISWWRYLSHSLDDTLWLYTSIEKFIDRKSLNKIYFTQLFLNIYPKLKEIDDSLRFSLHHYKNITWLPTKELEEQKGEAIKNIENFQWYLSKIINNFPAFLDILWHDKRKRYLIVFQNADEIRPTGWFMWSMGLLELFRGRVQLFQKKDVYAIEWDLKKSNYERLPAPKWIDELTSNFGLRDSNYYANIKDSSQAIKFFTDSAWIDLDWIIYINQNILLHLLDVSGPIYFEPLDIEITSENFSEVMSLVVEAKTFKKGTLWTPKQVLFDFMEVFSEKLMADGNYFSYLQTLVHDVESRDIMMWSFNENENDFLSKIWVNGKINYDKSLDYMYPVYTSLSWNKSDRYMNRSYSIGVDRVDDSCDFFIKTQIKSSHNMSKQRRDFVQSMIANYKLDSPNLFKIQGADRNRQFMRIILPTDSEIIPKVGTDIVDYGQRKWIEFFLETPEQQAEYYDYEYILANPNCQPYSTTLYKQPGIPSFDVKLNVFGKEFGYQWLEEDFYFEER